MQKIIVAGFCFFFLIACDSKTKQEGSEDGLFTDETIHLSPGQKLPWKLDYDSLTGDIKLKRQHSALHDTATAEGLIRDINALWPDVLLVYEKTAGDTIYVTIPDSEYLTQRMGSAGPQGYMTLVVYTLTELKGIRHIHFDFEEGDHAMPGTYSRDDFKNVR